LFFIAIAKPFDYLIDNINMDTNRILKCHENVLRNYVYRNLNDIRYLKIDIMEK